MVHVIKSLMKGVSALVFLAGLTLSYAPATEAEEAALGPDPARLALVQMRMAKVAMTVAPERAVQAVAETSGVPEAVVRDALVAVSEGRDPASAMSPAAVATPEQAQTTGRRIDAGGALFVTAPSSD